MAKINSKIDKALRKEVIENGVFLGHIASFGFNCNVYLYKNEVYRENFTINDDFTITDFARWTWYMVKSNITQFHPNEPYAEELIEYMTLYEHSLYLSNKKYREIAKEQFAELKKDYQESGLLDDINALLKKSKSKTFRYSKYESEKNVGESLKESMNLDYSDFDYKKFENWIIRYLEDYGCEVNTVEIICDDYGYDVEINVENAENLPSRISDKDYGAFIFDAMYTTNCLYLKMPIVRAMKIAEEFSPKVLKVNDDSILIGDKNSDTEIWLDVWTDNDGDEDYIEWDYNQQSFNLNNYEDMVQKYLQQIDDFFYILDGEVSDTF